MYIYIYTHAAVVLRAGTVQDGSLSGKHALTTGDALSTREQR